MDPLYVPQLEITVTLPHKAYTDGLASPDPLIRRTGCLILVEFYFIIRVGEYIKPKFFIQNGKRVSATCTKQFLVGNVGFFHNGTIMPRNSPLDMLLLADFSVLKKIKSEEWMYGPNHNTACNKHHDVTYARLGSHRIRDISDGRGRVHSVMFGS